MNIIIVSFLGILFSVLAWPTWAVDVEEDVDFSVMCDPFASPLPKKEIIKTPVEQIPQSGNNENISVSSPVTVPSAPPVPPQLRVQGIVWGVDRPQAIVNDTVVGVGDKVSGTQVKSIQKSGVNVVFQGTNIYVRMDQ